MSIADEPVQYRVEFKSSWGGNWTTVPYLTPLMFERADGTRIGQARFFYQWGAIKREDQTQYQTFAPIDLLNGYVRIWSQYGNQQERLRWLGIIVDEQATHLSLPTLTDMSIGDQQLTAFEMTYLLDRIIIDKAYVRYPSDGLAEPIAVDSTPTFNRADRVGAQLLGNRSAQTYNGSYYFDLDTTNDISDLWEGETVLTYLLSNISLGEFANNIYRSGEVSYLSTIYRHWNLGGRSMLAAINEIISRDLGFCWCLDFDSSDRFYLKVRGTSPAEIQVGVATIPQNYEQVPLLVPSIHPDNHILGEVTIRSTSARSYSEIEVRGAPVQVTATYQLGPGKDLYPAWNSAAETAYRDPGGADIEENDQIRSTDRFDGVWTTFTLPKNWLGNARNMNSTDSQDILPTVNPVDGSITLGAFAGNFWIGEKEFERENPFYVGVDYYAGAGGIPGWTSESALEYQPMVAFYRDQTDGDAHAKTDRYIHLDRIKESLPDVTQSVGVRPLDKQPGVDFSVTPRHLLALSYWDGANSDTRPEFKYGDIYVTASMKFDERIKIRRSTGLPGTRLTIDIPEAEVWVIAPGTMVDVNNDGYPVLYTGGSLIRDDRSMMEGVLAGALAWHGTIRRAASIPIYRVDDFVNMLAMVTEVTDNFYFTLPINGVVTSIKTDIVRGTTLIETNWMQDDYSPDFARFAPLSRSHTPKRVSRRNA